MDAPRPLDHSASRCEHLSRYTASHPFTRMGLSRLDWTAITVGATLLILRLALELFRYTLRRRSKPRRAALLAELGISEPEQAKKLVVGLFHPYWSAGHLNPLCLIC